MLAWLASNWGTILVCLIIIGVVFCIIASMRKNKKQGNSSCGGNCAHCGACGSCHSK